MYSWKERSGKKKIKESFVFEIYQRTIPFLNRCVKATNIFKFSNTPLAKKSKSSTFNYRKMIIF